MVGWDASPGRGACVLLLNCLPSPGASAPLPLAGWSQLLVADSCVHESKTSIALPLPSACFSEVGQSQQQQQVCLQPKPPPPTPVVCGEEK